MLNPYAFSLAIKRSWERQSNAFNRPVRSAPNIFLLSIAVFHFSNIDNRQCWALYLGRWLFSQKSSIVDVWQDCKKIGDISGMFEDIPRNVWRYSPKCLATFPGMFEDILPDCLRTFPGMFQNIPRNIIFLPFPRFSTFRFTFLHSWFYT